MLVPVTSMSMGNAVNRRHLFSAAAIGAGVAASGPVGGTQRTARRGAVIETRDGLCLHCRDIGEGRPLVFLAAWALPSDAWSYQTIALAEQGFRCITYDRRGHGR